MTFYKYRLLRAYVETLIDLYQNESNRKIEKHKVYLLHGYLIVKYFYPIFTIRISEKKNKEHVSHYN